MLIYEMGKVKAQRFHKKPYSRGRGKNGKWTVMDIAKAGIRNAGSIGNAIRSGVKHYNSRKIKTDRKRYTGASLQSISQHNDLSTGKQFISLGKRKLHDKTSTKFKYDHNYGVTHLGAEGKQLVYEGHVMLDTSSFLSATTARNQIVGVGAGFFSMNPNQNVTGSSIVGSGTSPVDSYINVEKVVQKLTVWNASTLAQEVYILWCTPNQNCNDGPLAYWGKCLANERIGTASSAQALLGSTATATFGSVVDTAVFGLYPTSSPMFRKMWKICGVRKIVLQGGDQKEVKTTIRINKKISRGYTLEQNNSGVVYTKGLTVIPMVIVRGALAINNFSGEEVVHGICKNCIAIDEHYVFSTCKAPTTSPIEYNFYGQLAGNVGTANERLVIDTDTVAAVTLVS
nr:MAG: capsid protein [Cressdnaviricota sp.]